MSADSREAADRSPPHAARIAGGVALAAVLMLAGALAVWDGTQLFGRGGAEHRRALAAAVMHPFETLREREARARIVSAANALWVGRGHVRPEARLLVAALARAGNDGADRRLFHLPELRRLVEAADSGDRAALQNLPSRLNAALTAYVDAERSPAPGVQVQFADPSLDPYPAGAMAVLEQAARAPSLSAFLSEARAGNGLATGLEHALQACRRQPSCGADEQRRLLANVERARALPADLGARYILVNVPEQRLWMVEHGRVVDSMPVVVGKLSEPTPELAAVVRAAVFNPYWNVPPDLTRDKIAPAVLRDGPRYLEAQRLEVMSGWTADAHPVDPSTVDWTAVAAGQLTLRVRQKPGPANMMGAVKFEAPNRLGIYLHDTPHRDAFGRSVRAESSGCVRLADARRLARWLLGSAADHPPSGTEARVDLPRPTPVYITYLTERVEDGQVVRSADIYRRDPALIATLPPVTSSAPVQEAAGEEAQ